jgi:16S rRNA (cytosine967-C5)-methyltransferase
MREQIAALDRGGDLVKPGGRLAYVTCSLLAEENDDQVRAFIERRPQFTPVPPGHVVEVLGERAAGFRDAVLRSELGLLTSPRRTDTDGFYVSLLKRQA